MKRIFAGFMLSIMLMAGTTFAGDGIIVFGKSSSTAQCGEQSSDFGTKILDAAAGIIILGRVGIIVFGRSECTAPATKQQTDSANGIIIFGN